MLNKIVSTQYIVLRKTPYMESSLIVSGISPTHGRIDLIVKGARKISTKASPEVDLFRVLNIQFSDRGKSLISPIVIEYVRDFDKLATKIEELDNILKLAPFILNNIHYPVRCEFLYDSLIKHLERVINGKRTYDWLIKLAYIHENGLLPHNLTISHSRREEETAQKLICSLLNYSNGTGEFPKVSEDYLKSFASWLNSFCSETLNIKDHRFQNTLNSDN